MRYVVSSLLFVLLLLAACETPRQTRLTVEPIVRAREALGEGGAPSWFADLPCECVSYVGPFPWSSPIAQIHTEQLGSDGNALPRCAPGDVPCMIAHAEPLPCSADSDCQLDDVKACRHAGCDQNCGFCVFQTYPPCMVDTCTIEGHHTTCSTPEDCTAAPFYDTQCIGGKCLILPDSSSGFYCAGPGDMRPIGQ